MIASLILALHFIGIVSLQSATSALYLTGVLLILAEFAVASLGLLILNGVLALYAAYALQTGTTIFFGQDIGWSLFFGIAFVEFSFLIASLIIWKRINATKPQTGTESMIGQKALILKWEGKKGRVQYEGETWEAKSDKEMEISIGDEVRILSINKLTLTIGN